MAQFRIEGGKPLKGTVSVAGNKNSALALIAASLVIDGPVTLTNVPNIRDVSVMAQIIQGLGARVEGIGTNKLLIDSANLSSWEPDPILTSKLRGSVLLIAPLLTRFGKAKMAAPGGDSIGERLLDTHFDLLNKFGVNIKYAQSSEPKSQNFSYEFSAPDINPTSIFFTEASVTATELGLIMASKLPGKTVLEDAAAEPHVQDLAEFLTKAGATIVGSGTNTIVVQGRTELEPVQHRVREDHIEVGMVAIASAITGGNLKIKDVRMEDLKMIFAYLSSMGVTYKMEDRSLQILPSELVAKRKVYKTRPWPGFPTDLMSSFIVLATQTKGTVLCHDWMYEWRIFFVDNLIKMGANITIADPHRIVVTGPTKLFGDIVPTPDIRAGSALVLAALCAQGESIIEHAEIIERGYENLDGRLRNIGAEIERIE